jgi:hypothetical protein
MNKYTFTQQQTNEMKFALKMFGVTRQYENDVIENTVNETDVVNALLMSYHDNEYGFEKNEYDTTIESMYEFLFDINEHEMNGVDENFSYTHELMNRNK